MPVVNLNFSKHVDEKALQDVFTQAVESATSYWADLENVTRAPDGKYISVDFRDNENGDFCGTITISAIALGMERLLTPSFETADNIRKDVLMLVVDPDNSNWDDETADCIIQAALFDEIVYG